MKLWKKILSVLLVIVLAAAGYAVYLYNKKPADVRQMKASYEITAIALMEEYNKDETAADQKYLDKVIAVRGKIGDIKIDSAGQANIILETGDPTAAVTCSFYDEEIESVKKVKPGDEVVIKGKNTGKLIDVVLNKCSIEK